MFNNLMEKMMEVGSQLEADATKPKSQVQSPREISEQTIQSIKERGLESVHDKVNSLLGEQINQHSGIEANKISKKNLLGILESYIEKWTLSELGALRLSGSQLSELERLYVFLRTSEGKNNLHYGIMEAMKIKTPSLNQDDIDSLKKLRNNPSKAEVQAITKSFQRVEKYITLVNATWTYLHLYIREIQIILLQSYTHELSLAQNNAKRTKELYSRLGESNGSDSVPFESMARDYVDKIKAIGDDLGLNKYTVVRMK